MVGIALQATIDSWSESAVNRENMQAQPVRVKFPDDRFFPPAHPPLTHPPKPYSSAPTWNHDCHHALLLTAMSRPRGIPWDFPLVAVQEPSPASAGSEAPALPCPALPKGLTDRGQADSFSPGREIDPEAQVSFHTEQVRRRSKPIEPTDRPSRQGTIDGLKPRPPGVDSE